MEPIEPNDNDITQWKPIVFYDSYYWELPSGLRLYRKEPYTNEDTCLWTTTQYQGNHYWETGCENIFRVGTPYQVNCPACGREMAMLGSCISPRSMTMTWEITSEKLPPAGVQVYLLVSLDNIISMGFYDGLFPMPSPDSWRGSLDNLQRWMFVNSDGKTSPMWRLPDFWCLIKEPG